MQRGGEGGPGGQGGPGGEGGRPHPLFGTILSIDQNSITIKPEIPDFVKKKMAEMRQRGGGQSGPGGAGAGPGGPGGPEGPGGPGAGGGPGGKRGKRELPPQVTVNLSAQTKY